MQKKKKKCWVTNRIVHYSINIEQLQEFLDRGFYRGQLPSKVDRSWYTNGVEDRHFINQPVPDGWWRGRTSGVHNPSKGKMAIHNESCVRFISKDSDIPDGYEKGIGSFSKEHKEKISKSLTGKQRSKQHCENLSLSHRTESYKSKIESTCLKRYGVKNPFQDPEFIKRNTSPEKIAKKNATKRRNNTFRSSKLEDSFYLMLCKVYQQTDICRQYTDERYPFNCDFYIKSEDLFIEINGFVTHQDHPFDKNCPEDVAKAEYLKNSSSEWCKNIYHVWVESDPIKKENAMRNSINYMVYYGMNIDTPSYYFLSREETEFKIFELFNYGKQKEVADRVKHTRVIQGDC